MASIRELARLVDADGKRVVEFLLPGHSNARWHCHTGAVEHCYCLSGTLNVDLANGESVALLPGERCEIALGAVHRVANRNGADCRFLVVQNGTHYDFVVVEGEPADRSPQR